MIKCEKYDWQKIIGEGAFSQVREAIDSTNGKKCAIKLFKSYGDDFKDNIHEAQILEALNHKNIIKLFDYNVDASMTKGGKTKKVCYIATELAENGCLYDHIEAGQRLNEPLARYFASQVLDAVEYIHSEGIWHRDIKAENIFLNSDLSIKLGDFGFATKDIESNEQKGSGYYMAPEINNRETYNCKSVDIFALGVLFFMMVVGKYPFTSANIIDCLYKLIYLNKIELFWRTAVRNRQFAKQISPEFKEMVTLMLSVDPMERPTITEIKAMSWFSGKTLSKDEAEIEIEKIQQSNLKKNEEYVSFH
jgi:serine/threonine protein kinase